MNSIPGKKRLLSALPSHRPGICRPLTIPRRIARPPPLVLPPSRPPSAIDLSTNPILPMTAFSDDLVFTPRETFSAIIHMMENNALRGGSVVVCFLLWKQNLPPSPPLATRRPAIAGFHRINLFPDRPDLVGNTRSRRCHVSAPCDPVFGYYTTMPTTSLRQPSWESSERRRAGLPRKTPWKATPEPKRWDWDPERANVPRTHRERTAVPSIPSRQRGEFRTQAVSPRYLFSASIYTYHHLVLIVWRSLPGGDGIRTGRAPCLSRVIADIPPPGTEPIDRAGHDCP